MTETDTNNDLLAEDGDKHWYAIHTYAGYEDAVARNLQQRIDSMDMGDLIFDVIVPTKQVMKVKRGKRVEEQERIYPGYVLVQMKITEDSWYVVRNTPRVTGFVGSGTQPDPLAKEEVEELFSQMSADSTEHEINLSEGDAVRVINGPFDELEGTVSEIDRERGKVKVLVNMFGRETPVELDFLQVQRI